MKFKYKIIIIVSLVIAALAYLIYGFIDWQKKESDKRASCHYLNNERYGGFVDPINFIDCFDIFSIEQELIVLKDKKYNVYNIRDDKNNYYIATINDLKNYTTLNNQLYIFEPLIFSGEEYSRVRYGDQPWQYSKEYFINGEVKEVNFKSPWDFPNYIQVLMATGEVTLYNTYDQMPDVTKTIFKELE